MAANIISAIICSIFFASIALILTPILIIFELFRQFLKIVLCLKHRKKIHIMRSVDSTMVIFKESTEVIFTGYLIFQGTVDLERIRNTVKTKWIDAKFPNGKYKYYRLRSRVAFTCGFYYWLPQDQISVQEHVQIYNCVPPKNEKELCLVFSDIISESLPADKPQWLVLIIPLDNMFARENRYLIVLRFHHVIADGFTALRMINIFFDEKTLTFFTPKMKKKTNCSIKFKNILATIFYYPHYCLRNILTRDVNFFHVHRQSGIRIAARVTEISFSRLKQIQQLTGTTTNHVFVSCVAGAFYKFFCAAEGRSKFRALIPVSLHNPRKIVTFKNKISFFVYNLPVESGNAVERLRKTQKELEELKNYKFYYLNYVCVKLIYNRLPAYVTRFTYGFNSCTCILTNVPGYTDECFSQFGEELRGFGAFPTHNNNIGLSVAITSYNKGVCLGLSADKLVMDNSDIALRFLNNVIDEIEELETLLSSTDEAAVASQGSYS